jgi:hypothetical protein
MQTSRDQIEDGLFGFALETAVSQIIVRGYYLFMGSTKLLDARVIARSAPPPGQADAPPSDELPATRIG